MLIGRLENLCMNLPLVRRYYHNRAAKIKRNTCLLLRRLGLLKPFSFVQWLATYDCNLHCPFCEASAGKAAPNELTTKEVKGLIDDLSKMGVRRFLISGGEPLVRKDLIEVMEYANQRNLQLGLVSNGYLVAEQWDRLKHFNYFLYFTSIDGPPEHHNKMRGGKEAFEKTMKGLELFGALGVPIRMVKTVVHPENLGHLEDLLKILKSSPANRWHLSPVAKVGRAASGKYSLLGKQLRNLADFMKGNEKVMNIDFSESHAYLGCFLGNPIGRPFFCGAGLTRCSIMPDGEVLGCQQVYDRSLSEGNIRNKPFPQIWKEGFSRFRRRDFPVICRGCAHLSGCQAGCWAEMEKQGVCLKSVWEEKT